ncbi:hypothetical protein FKM82_008720 [Ascaphus truei]
MEHQILLSECGTMPKHRRAQWSKSPATPGGMKLLNLTWMNL